MEFEALEMGADGWQMCRVKRRGIWFAIFVVVEGRVLMFDMKQFRI